MDLAVYINELLQQQGQLSIPGLGLFGQVRVDGCYQEDKRVFLPPHYETQFERQNSTDETLARYISSKKNISVASAVYFVDKYVNNIRQQSAEGEVQMAQLGWMRLDDNKLKFRPNSVTNTYEGEYFGLPALSVPKIWEQLSGASHHPEPVEPAPIETITAEAVAPAPVPAPTPELSIFPEVLTLRDEEEPAPKPVKPVKQQTAPSVQQEQEEYTEPRSSVNPWILVLVIVTVAAIILLALYQYKPSLFSPRKSTAAESGTTFDNEPVKSEKKADTIQTTLTNREDTLVSVPSAAPSTTAATPAVITAKDSARADVSAQTDQPAAPVNAASKYQIMAGAFGNVKLAKQDIDKYRKQGITAWVFENRSGRSVKITQGTFPTYEAAAARLAQLKSTGKAIKGAYVLRQKQKN